jgi:predicted DNA-binding transcriptional regulator AlpA
MILTLPEVARATRLSPTSIRRMVSKNLFPRPVEYPCRKTVWRADQVAEWVMRRSPLKEESPETWADRLKALVGSLTAGADASGPS